MKKVSIQSQIALIDKLISIDAIKGLSAKRTSNYMLLVDHIGAVRDTLDWLRRHEPEIRHFLQLQEGGQ